MSINPFKESNLEDLKSNASNAVGEFFSSLWEKFKYFCRRFHKKGCEKVTLMFIPHTEKRIVNFHISIYSIFTTVVIVTATTIITSFLIVNHASTIKEVEKLVEWDEASQEQLLSLGVEIEKLTQLVDQNLKYDFKNVFRTIYGIERANNLFAIGGGSDSSDLSGLRKENFNPETEVIVLNQLKVDLQIIKDNIAHVRSDLTQKKTIIENTPSIKPTNGHTISTFGKRKSPISFRDEFATGIDISSFPGAEIVATAPGEVESIQWHDSMGLQIRIKHRYGFSTIYSHCQRATVTVDQKVNRGDVIGFVGRTGKAPMHILHYQIQIGMQFVDPQPYLNKIVFE